MKYKYCQNCKKAYIRSRLEKDNCIYCNKPCETVEVKRNGLYFVGYIMTGAGAGIVLYPRLAGDVSDTSFFMITGIVIFLGGAVLVMMGSVRMAQTAARAVLTKEDEES